ncbi:MAG: OadG family protein [Calditrichia bacterium]
MKLLLTVNISGIIETALNRISSGHGILVAIIGLLAVFAGLLILWGITSLLPMLISAVENSGSKADRLNSTSAAKTAEGERQPENDHSAIAVAIGVALCCELDEEDVSVITLRQIEQEMSPWVVASRPSTMRHS